MRGAQNTNGRGGHNQEGVPGIDCDGIEYELVLVLVLMLDDDDDDVDVDVDVVDASDPDDVVDDKDSLPDRRRRRQPCSLSTTVLKDPRCCGSSMSLNISSSSSS